MIRLRLHRRRGAVIVGSLLCVATCLAQPPAGDSRSRELVRQLGDSDFAVRERATEQLLQMGVAAEPALEAALNSPDREVRYRSDRLLIFIRELKFQARLDAFAAGQQLDPPLPAWEAFQKEVGDSPASRRLFIEMQKSEPQLLITIQNDPNQVAAQVSSRVAQLQAWVQFNRSQVQIPLGSVSALLFAVIQEGCELPVNESQMVASYFHQSSFSSAMTDGEEKPYLRSMLGSWIRKSDGWNSYMAMHFAMQYGIPDGLVPAEKVLKNSGQQPNPPNFVQYAILTVARFGNATHVPLVEPFLEDATVIGGAVRVGNQVRAQTQLRDIALACLVHVSKQDPKQFGLERIQPNPIYAFNTVSVGFGSDEQRLAAIAKWHEFRKDQDRTP